MAFVQAFNRLKPQPDTGPVPISEMKAYYESVQMPCTFEIFIDGIREIER